MNWHFGIEQNSLAARLFSCLHRLAAYPAPATPPARHGRACATLPRSGCTQKLPLCLFLAALGSDEASGLLLPTAAPRSRYPSRAPWTCLRHAPALWLHTKTPAVSVFGGVRKRSSIWPPPSNCRAPLPLPLPRAIGAPEPGFRPLAAQNDSHCLFLALSRSDKAQPAPLTTGAPRSCYPLLHASNALACHFSPMDAHKQANITG